MSRRVNAYAALLAVTAVAMAAAASASASGPGGGGSGGAGLGGSTTARADLGLATSTRFIGGKIGIVSPGNMTLTATQNGITLDANAATMLGSQLVIKGVAPRSAAGSTVQIERLGHQTHWAWAATTQAKVGADGSFSAVWKTNHIGRFQIQAVVGQTSGPVVMITVFRPSYATWYNLFGNHTACGELLTRKTLGLANRTLPCGMRVAIYFNGKTIVVPVIDRGPYGGRADWDLTEATASAIGMGGSDQIGAVSLPRKP